MKLLLIDETYRRWLFYKHAIGFDSDLNERLVGLTHGESVIYLEQASQIASGTHDRSEEWLDLFIALFERHNAATEIFTRPGNITSR